MDSGKMRTIASRKAYDGVRIMRGNDHRQFEEAGKAFCQASLCWASSNEISINDGRSMLQSSQSSVAGNRALFFESRFGEERRSSRVGVGLITDLEGGEKESEGMLSYFSFFNHHRNCG